MKKILTVLPFVLASLLSACATNQLYDSFQSSAREKCNSLPESDRSACVARNRDSYDTYKKKREEVGGGVK